MGGGWGRIWWFYLLGVMAAAQLGKMSALMPLVSRDLGLGLTPAALAISLLEIGGATLGRVAGTLAGRLGTRAALLGGLGLLAAAGLGESAAGGAAGLIAWRVLEGIGYLGVVIAAPLMIVEAAGPRRRDTALALWSSFVPVGLALGAAVAAAAAKLVSWRLVLLGEGVLMAAALACTAALPAPAAAGAQAVPGRGRPGAAAWALAMGFGCYTCFQVGMLALLPTFLVAEAGTDPATAGAVTGAASFATVAGSALAAWHGRRGGGRPGGLLAVSIVVPAVLLFAAFRPGAGLAATAVLSILLNALSGILPGLAFPLLARIAEKRGGMTAATGLLTQFGAGGALCGPPLFAAAVSLAGWQAAALCGAAASCACLLLMRHAGRT